MFEYVLSSSRNWFEAALYQLWKSELMQTIIFSIYASILQCFNPGQNAILA